MLIFKSPTNGLSLSRLSKAGKIRRLASGIYSTDLETEPAAQVQQNLTEVLSHVRPGAIISHRSAIQSDFGFSEGVIVMTDPELKGRNYEIVLPGVTLMITPGSAQLEGDTPLGKEGSIYISSPARSALENLEPARPLKHLNTTKSCSRDVLWQYLDARFPTSKSKEGFLIMIDRVLVQTGGTFAREEGLLKEEINQRLLKEQKSPLYVSPEIDHPRIRLFEQLATQLKLGLHGNQEFANDLLPDFPSRPSTTDPRFLNLAFFESYFSNYIEGTEFDAKEAYELAHSDVQQLQRIKDGHDIRALYQLYANPDFLLKKDHTPQEFLENLKSWHAHFGDHPTKESIRPGQFKDRANRAGNTWFTEPHQVEETLKAAWEIGETLTTVFDKAIFRAISTVAVHPFIDGNGRITRLASSSVFAQAGKIHPFVPTVFREDYILAMRAFSNGDPIPVIRMYRRAIQMTASVPWDKPFPELNAWLKNMNAFADPQEAKWGATPPQTQDLPHPYRPEDIRVKLGAMGEASPYLPIKRKHS